MGSGRALKLEPVEIEFARRTPIDTRTEWLWWAWDLSYVSQLYLRIIYRHHYELVAVDPCTVIDGMLHCNPPRGRPMASKPVINMDLVNQIRFYVRL